MKVLVLVTRGYHESTSNLTGAEHKAKKTANRWFRGLFNKYLLINVGLWQWRYKWSFRAAVICKSHKREQSVQDGFNRDMAQFKRDKERHGRKSIWKNDIFILNSEDWTHRSGKQPTPNHFPAPSPLPLETEPLWSRLDFCNSLFTGLPGSTPSSYSLLR